MCGDWCAIKRRKKKKLKKREDLAMLIKDAGGGICV
jgi:hypothetical protein